MKTHSRVSKPISMAIAVVALSLANGGQLGAIPSPEQHEMSGTVLRVDQHTITILVTGDSKPVVFAWNKDTRFVRDGAGTTVDALRSGVQVTTRCSHPIIGSHPLLYRLAWQTTSMKKNQ